MLETKDQRSKRLARVRNLSKTCEQAGALQFINNNLPGCSLVVNELFTTPADREFVLAWYREGAWRRDTGKAPGDPPFKSKGLTTYGLCVLTAHALGMVGTPLSALVGDSIVWHDSRPVSRD